MGRQVEEERKDLSDAELGDTGRVDGFDKKKFPKYVLTPGDPDRIHVMAQQWDSAEEFVLGRGHRAATGVYKGVDIAAYSSGVGGPSMEPVLTDLAALGVHTIIRVGTTGALQDGMNCGELVINEASVRMDGTSRLYVRDEFPAAASYEATLALVEACDLTGLRCHVGIGATAGSFFAGQGRASFGGYKRSGTDEMVTDLQQANVLNFEMEAAALFTLSRLFGIRSGAVCAIVANRVTGEWAEEDGIENACLAGAEAVRLLHTWDQKKLAAGKRYFHPGLMRE
jgi:uridine phosphorylase